MLLRALEVKQIFPVRIGEVSERPERAARSFANTTPDQDRRRRILWIIEKHTYRVANVAHQLKFWTGIHPGLLRIKTMPPSGV
jgi:hypothetical protein